MSRRADNVLDQTLPAGAREVVTIDGQGYLIPPMQDVILHIPNASSRRLPLAWLSSVPDAWASVLHGIMCDMLGAYSMQYVVGTACALRDACQEHNFLSEAQLSMASVSRLLASDTHWNYVSLIRMMLSRVLDESPGLLSDELASFLRDGVAWEERGNGEYFALLTNCPEAGALTEQELNSIHGALNESYSSGEISQQSFTLMWMSVGTGIRPIQMARMTRGDVTVHNGPEGAEVMLAVPMAKGKAQTKGEYWLRRAPSVLAEALTIYLESTEGKPSDPLFMEKSGAISERIRAVGQRLDTHSERLGTQIPLNAYRFRYTLATRALAHGASDWEVARLLTHRSTACISYYRASMPQLLDPIEGALGDTLGFIARAFRGKLIGGMHEATRHDDASAEIIDFLHLTGESVGACGSTAQCYQNAPIACLSCARFEPFREAPWEELLSELESDAARENDPRIRMINLGAMSAVQDIMTERDVEVADV